jgi:hypothetical protein
MMSIPSVERNHFVSFYICVGGSGMSSIKKMCLPPADSELAQFLRGIDMQTSVFTPSRPYVENDNNFDNQILDANRRRGNPFWGFVDNMLGLPAEHMPFDAQGDNWELAAVRRRDERIQAANQPPGLPTPLAAIAAEVADHITETVRKVAKVTKTQAAVEWLREVLRDGPVRQKEIEVLARKEGINISVAAHRKAFYRGNEAFDILAISGKHFLNPKVLFTSRSSAALRVASAATTRAFSATAAASRADATVSNFGCSSALAAAHCVSSSAALAAALALVSSTCSLASADPAEATARSAATSCASAPSFKFSATRIIARAASREAVTAASLA